MASVPRAPGDLVRDGRGRRFWSAVVADYHQRVDELELLREYCRMLDLADVLREASDPPIVQTRSGPKVNPALVELRQVRMELRRTGAALGLEDGEPDELPEGVSRLRSQRARRAARARWSKDARGA